MKSTFVKRTELEDMNETSRARSDNKCHQQWNGPKSFLECLCRCCMSLECCALEAYLYGTQLWLRGQKLSDLVLRCLMHPGLHGNFLALALKIPRLENPSIPRKLGWLVILPRAWSHMSFASHESLQTWDGFTSLGLYSPSVSLKSWLPAPLPTLRSCTSFKVCFLYLRKLNSPQFLSCNPLDSAQSPQTRRPRLKTLSDFLKVIQLVQRLSLGFLTHKLVFSGFQAVLSSHQLKVQRVE